MQSVGIVGASGYSGEVLLEILSRHPEVDQLVVASRSHAGKTVESILPRLAGMLGDLCFTQADPAELAELDVSVWFLALPHGVAAEYALALVDAGKTVIDLSADFRLNSPDIYEQYYGHAHPEPQWLSKVPYVIPEFTGSGWEAASLIACPGCYPTSILVPLLPLLAKGVVPGNGIVINSMSGVSGAGKKESNFYSYCERSESALAYGLGTHRHLSEIEEQLSAAAGKEITVQFTPHLIPLMRGIGTTIVLPSTASIDEVYAAWEEAYAGKQGIRILPSGKAPDTRNVTGRNRVDISAFVDERTGNLLITSAIDNLMKGASGQAVQIMNLKMGWPEFTGLI
ncbi:MAG: N-acetyl-gamma-glutamyl-phosphate reductase [Puniceicoccaceae bacterium]